MLDLGLQTVRSYRKTMMKKLGVNNVAGLTQLALAAGITHWNKPDSSPGVIAQDFESFRAPHALTLYHAIEAAASPHPASVLSGLAVTLAVECKGTCAGLSGTFRDLTRAASAGARVRRMIFALHYPGSPFLSETERDQLWEIFEGAGVCRAVRSRRGAFSPMSAKAQSGLHVGPRAPWSASMLESAPCECGRPGPASCWPLRPPYRALFRRPSELSPVG